MNKLDTVQEYGTCGNTIIKSWGINTLKLSYILGAEKKKCNIRRTHKGARVQISLYFLKGCLLYYSLTWKYILCNLF